MPSGMVDSMSAELSADPAVAALVDACRALAEEAFGARLLAVYLIGSLAHGGFAPAPASQSY